MANVSNKLLFIFVIAFDFECVAKSLKDLTVGYDTFLYAVHGSLCEGIFYSTLGVVLNLLYLPKPCVIRYLYLNFKAFN